MIYEYEFNSRTIEVDYDVDKRDPLVGFEGGIHINGVKCNGHIVHELPEKLEDRIIEKIFEEESEREYEEKAMRAEWEHDIDR